MESQERVFEIIETMEKNKTLKVDGILLHSKYNPIKEANVFLNRNVHIYENKKNIVIYGIGLGYHISELLKRISSDVNIYIFDADETIIDFAMNIGSLKDVLKNKKVKLFKGYYDELLTELAKKLSLVDDILIFKPSIKILPDKFKELSDVIKGYELGKIAVERFKDTMSKNEILNLSVKHYEIENFYDCYKLDNEPVIIVSAGPSLDYSITSLKKLKGKVKIFAVASALKPLMQNSIKPDMICVIDCQDIVYEQIRGYENLNIPLCFLSTASNLTVSRYNGPKYLFYNYKKDINIVIETGKSVATALLSIAIQGKAKEVIFVGQDLAYINNKSHSDFYVYGNNVPGNGTLKKVIGVNGEILDTTDGLLYFKNWIENTIKKNPQITFVNCSKGAKINGTFEKNIEDLIVFR